MEKEAKGEVLDLGTLRRSESGCLYGGAPPGPIEGAGGLVGRACRCVALGSSGRGAARSARLPSFQPTFPKPRNERIVKTLLVSLATFCFGLSIAAAQTIFSNLMRI